MVKLLLAPVSVQGLEAEKSIVDGIRRLDARPAPGYNFNHPRRR